MKSNGNIQSQHGREKESTHGRRCGFVDSYVVHESRGDEEG